GAEPPLPRSGASRGHHVRMMREPQVIVARERDQLAPADDDARTLRRFDGAACASEAIGGTPRESRFELGDAVQAARRRRLVACGGKPRHGGMLRIQTAVASPSFPKNARSASTSGLPVVRSLSP